MNSATHWVTKQLWVACADKLAADSVEYSLRNIVFTTLLNMFVVFLVFESKSATYVGAKVHNVNPLMLSSSRVSQE